MTDRGSADHGPGWPALGNRIAPPRFLLFLALLVLGFAACRLLTPTAGWQDSAAMAFDGAAACFLVSLVPLLRDSRVEDIRRHASRNDANRLLILIVTSLMTLLVMAAISGELADARQGQMLAAAKLVVTLLLIWLFTNSVYTLHYAHAYYALDGASGGDRGGLDFPGTRTPDYSDFAYFAFTLGMTFQTSDVGIAAAGIRRIALLHSFAAFVFNIGVIAFTINVLGG